MSSGSGARHGGISDTILGRIEWPTPHVTRWPWPISAEPHRCPVCEGRGMMPESFYARRRPMVGDGQVKCRSCDGRGIIR